MQWLFVLTLVQKQITTSTCHSWSLQTRPRSHQNVPAKTQMRYSQKWWATVNRSMPCWTTKVEAPGILVSKTTTTQWRRGWNSTRQVSLMSCKLGLVNYCRSSSLQFSHVLRPFNWYINLMTSTGESTGRWPFNICVSPYCSGVVLMSNKDTSAYYIPTRRQLWEMTANVMKQLRNERHGKWEYEWSEPCVDGVSYCMHSIHSFYLLALVTTDCLICS